MTASDNIFTHGLEPSPTNYTPLSPLSLLAHFKCPKTVVFGELPKTSTGKIQKFKLREHASAMGSL